MFPGSALAIAQSLLDEDFSRTLDGHHPPRHRRSFRAPRRDAGRPAATETDAGVAEVPPELRPVTFVGASLVARDAEASDIDERSIEVEAKPATLRTRLHLTTLAALAVLVVAVGAAVFLGQRVVSEANRASAYSRQLDSAATRADQLLATSSQHVSIIAQLRTRLSQMQDRLADVRASKVRTVVKTEVVTKQVPRWVPSGKGIEVDTTGFQGRIAIHDVQLTKAYGYSHLIGIAINRSGETVSYAQLGCTFVDVKGRLLANEMVNKASWAPGQSWGFDCSAQVDGTGGVLRVDEMT